MAVSVIVVFFSENCLLLYALSVYVVFFRKLLRRL